MDIIEAMQTNLIRAKRYEERGSADELQCLTYGMFIRAMVAQGTEAAEFVQADREWQHMAEDWDGPVARLREAFRVGYADTMEAGDSHARPLRVRDPRSLPRRAVPLGLARHLGL